jgi:ribosomal protein S18 acetylase RimI-like enzyme
VQVDVRPIQGRLGRRRFVDLPYRVLGGDPRWVPPLRLSVYDRISPKHPANATQRTQLWMAHLDGRPVGRIGACIDTTFDNLHGERWCWVGFFDCVDSEPVAATLFDAARAWARVEGATTCVGPASFTLNDECGLLVDNFEDPPLFLTTYNPPYYERLWTAAGWEQTMDLWGWRFERPTTELSERQTRVLHRLQERAGVTIRSARMSDFDAEIERLFEVYNAAWVQNWGFSPMSQDEVRHLAKQVKPIIDPNLVLIAETTAGEAVGVAIVLPDVNESLGKIRSGRLLPIGWYHLLRDRKHPHRARVFALGIKPDQQVRALGPLLYNAIIERLRAIPTMDMVEASWILATNDRMNGAIEAIGATHYRTWRMYRCEP